MLTVSEILLCAAQESRRSVNYSYIHILLIDIICHKSMDDIGKYCEWKFANIKKFQFNIWNIDAGVSVNSFIYPGRFNSYAL